MTNTQVDIKEDVDNAARIKSQQTNKIFMLTNPDNITQMELQQMVNMEIKSKQEMDHQDARDVLIINDVMTTQEPVNKLLVLNQQTTSKDLVGSKDNAFHADPTVSQMLPVNHVHHVHLEKV